MTLNKYSSIVSLFLFVLIGCVACGNRGETTELSTQAASEATAIAARLTAVVATDESNIQSANAEPAVTVATAISEPLAALVSTPITGEATRRLSVEIVRASPPALVPPTATFTAVPPTLAEPTNTPILLVSEPALQQPLPVLPLLQTPEPEPEPSNIPGVDPVDPSAEENINAEGRVVNFAGRWFTNVGTIYLDQSGEQVTGSYQLYGDSIRYELSGTISGRTLSGRYSGFDGGTFNFVLDPDEVSFDGNWFYQGAGTANHWCGVRSGPLKPWCGFSGPWESIGDYVADTPPVTEIVQTRDQIQGTFVNGVYAETGIIQGQVGREGTGSQLIASGRWSIAGFSGDFRWVLQDQKSDQSIGYSTTSDGVLHQWCNWRPGLSMPDGCFEP